MMCACGADADLVLHIFRQLFKEMRIQMIDDSNRCITKNPTYWWFFYALTTTEKTGVDWNGEP